MARPKSSLGLIVCLLLPVTALAHPGHEASSFLAGAVHPLGGLDHLLAMLAVGLLAGGNGGSLRWGLPATFVTAMILGAVFGMSGVTSPMIEVGIAASLIVFGAALVLKGSLRTPTLIALTASFALFHGHAHGMEMGASVLGLPYVLGFVLATALLHAVGVRLATITVSAFHRTALLTWSGRVIATVGALSLAMLLVIPA